MFSSSFSLYLSNFSNVYSQLLSAFNSTVLIGSSFSFTNNPTVTTDGLFPSTFSLSVNDLLTDTVLYSFSTSSVVPGTGVSSCVATSFLTSIFSALNGLILTVNVIVFSSPGNNVTSIPLFNSCSVYSLSSPVKVMFPTNVVPAGTWSATFTVPFPSPLFVDVNLYVIVSNSCNTSFEAILSFTVVIFATFVSTSSVSSSPTVAIFLTVLTTSLLFSLFITTIKLTVEAPPFFVTFIVIPLAKSSAVYVESSPFTLMLPSTNVVPVGIVSFTIVAPSSFPLFVAVIV